MGGVSSVGGSSGPKKTEEEEEEEEEEGWEYKKKYIGTYKYFKKGRKGSKRERDGMGGGGGGGGREEGRERGKKRSCNFGVHTRRQPAVNHQIQDGGRPPSTGKIHQTRRLFAPSIAFFPTTLRRAAQDPSFLHSPFF